MLGDQLDRLFMPHQVFELAFSSWFTEEHLIKLGCFNSVTSLAGSHLATILRVLACLDLLIYITIVTCCFFGVRLCTRVPLVFSSSLSYELRLLWIV